MEVEQKIDTSREQAALETTPTETTKVEKIETDKKINKKLSEPAPAGEAKDDSQSVAVAYKESDNVSENLLLENSEHHKNAKVADTTNSSKYSNSEQNLILDKTVVEGEQETSSKSKASNAEIAAKKEETKSKATQNKYDVSETVVSAATGATAVDGNASSAGGDVSLSPRPAPGLGPALVPATQSQPETPTTQATAPVAPIPENILSPPKSETQTDETNTATSSSSPASDSQLSPSGGDQSAVVTPTARETSETVTSGTKTSPKATSESGGGVTATTVGTSPSQTSTPTPSPGGTRVVQPINVVANGTIPKSGGKPQMSAMNKKLNKPTRAQRPRKPKVAMYESEISDNKIGIKLCIKKSDTTGSGSGGGGGGGATTTATPTTPTASSLKISVSGPTSVASNKQVRKRSRKSKVRPRLDSDDSEYETKRKKDRTNNNGERQKKVSFSANTAGADEEAPREPVEQSDWGEKLPEPVLYHIFQMVVERDGSLPTLCRLGRVCSLWWRVSLSPGLWKVMDLSTWINNKYRTELKLKWLVDNRCGGCTELNVSNWKVSDIHCFLGKLAKGCPNLMSINLSGWKGFTSDHLAFLVDNMKKLQRIDLSSVNVEMNASKSAVGLQSLCNALQTMKSNLTHLYLAHNRLAGIPQIVNTLSTHCPNLMLLDLSNVTTQATSHGILHIEKLQAGCQKLKVLRVTNSHVTLGPATMQEMMDSLGFPDLEELSVAALTDEARIIGDEHLQRILKTSSKLKLLDVRGCTRLTHESLIRLPAWDIKHLFLSFCSVTRDTGSGLELIASKWAHSLIELDLAWANVQQPLDNALRALAEKGSESPLAHLNLCGSSVSDEAVKEILANCAHMSSINLSSCRGLPRGVKRLMQGPQELQELRDVLKVQMKVKLPAQLKQEEEEAAAVAAAAAACAKMETNDDSGGSVGGVGKGGGSSGNSQSN